MDFSHLPFTQQMQVHEANVRGVYLSIACDYEQLMNDVIFLCGLGEGEKPANGEIIAFKNQHLRHLEMGKKFRRTKRALEKYNPEYFKDFHPYFDIIERLVMYRTILSHGYSSYDPNQKDKSFIVFEHLYQGKVYTERIVIYPFLTQMEHYRSCIMELAGLCALLRKERGLL